MVEKRKLRAGAHATGHGHLLERRVIDEDGRFRTMLAVDLRSPTFSDDLLALFTRNVERARRENKRLLGVRDRVPGGT